MLAIRCNALRFDCTLLGSAGYGLATPAPIGPQARPRGNTRAVCRGDRCRVGKHCPPISAVRVGKHCPPIGAVRVGNKLPTLLGSPANAPTGRRHRENETAPSHVIIGLTSDCLVEEMGLFSRQCGVRREDSIPLGYGLAREAKNRKFCRPHPAIFAGHSFFRPLTEITNTTKVA